MSIIKTHPINMIDLENIQSNQENHKRLILQIDFIGNVYFKYGNDYYIISLDISSNTNISSNTDTGIEITKIKNPSYFRDILIDSVHFKTAIKSGVINASDMTLRGKAHQTMKNMTDDEKDDYLEKNDYMDYDDGCLEKRYFWVRYEDEDNEDDENYYINGAVEESEVGKSQGMVYSDLLALYPGSFEVILIQGDHNSKKVISNTEKMNGFNSGLHLIVYTGGFVKVSFMNTNILSKICVDNTDSEIPIKIIKFNS